MLKRPLLALSLALLLAVGFCFGLAHLFALRYQAGEVYPPYSTLRADPVGAKAIYEALGGLPGFEARRNFQPLKKLRPLQPVTLVYAGVSRQSYWTEREVQELETLLANGSRVLLAFYPIDLPPPPDEVRREQAKERVRKREEAGREEEKDPDKSKKEKAKSPLSEISEDGVISFAKFAEYFGFRFDFHPSEPGKSYDRHAFLIAAGAALETDISWHSAVYFTDLSSDWKPLYLSNYKPVVAERTYGRGSIVIASDSFFLSNEALRRERHLQFLAHLFSGPRLVVFDEEHLGVTEEPGIATLVKKYRLQGVIAGLVLLAALFVWKNVARFLPLRADRGDDGDVVVGKDSAQGFTNLLRRSIKPANVLRVCIEEWRRGAAPPAREVAVVEELWAQEQARPPKQRDSAAAYRAIAQTLSRKGVNGDR